MIRIILILIFGLVFGSFSALLIYRLPLDMSIVSPRSHCKNCGNPIKWHDNIPLVSYLLLGGKCRYCKNKISIINPIVEALNALLWLLIYFLFGLNVYSIILMICVTILIAIAFIDAKHQIIPDSLNIVLFCLGIVAVIYSVFNPEISNILENYCVLWWERIISGTCGGLIFLMVRHFFSAALKKESLGLGDVKFISAIGLLFGYKILALTIFFSSLYACFFLLIKAICGKKTTEAFAFGPFLVAGTITAAFFGNYLISLYVSLF